MSAIEKEFFSRRTAGEDAHKLSILTGNPGYGDEEVAKEDEFPNAYMGKVYGDNVHYELMSMAVEYFFFKPEEFFNKFDEDLQDFVLGCLTIQGK